MQQQRYRIRNRSTFNFGPVDGTSVSRRYLAMNSTGSAPQQTFRGRLVHVALLWTVLCVKYCRVDSLLRDDDDMSSFWRRDNDTDTAKQRQLQSTEPVSSPTKQLAIRRVNAGGENEYFDANGVSWGPDEWYGNKGRRITPSECSGDILNTTDDILYCSNRYFPSSQFDSPFQYTIPLPYTALYEVRLHFAEVSFNAVGRRVFTVRIEGVNVIKNLDVFARAGALTAYSIAIQVLVTDRTVNIQFVPVVDDPFISAIEVVEVEMSPAPTITPSSVSKNTPTSAPINAVTSGPILISSNVTFTDVIRLNAGGDTLVDSMNNTWASDAYFQGDAVVGDKACSGDIVNTTDDALFCTERYFIGNNTQPFTYEIPVGSIGDYQVRLFFAENHFNESGKRLFDVLVEGIVVIQNFDIFEDAGGPVTPYVVSVVSNVADAFLSIEFIQKRNNPTISAIEIFLVADDATSTVSAVPSSSPTFDVIGQAVAECAVYPVCVEAGYKGSCCPQANGTARDCCSGIFPSTSSPSSLPSSLTSNVPSVSSSTFPSIVPTYAESLPVVPTETETASVQPSNVKSPTSESTTPIFEFNITLISVSGVTMVLGRNEQVSQESLAADSNCTEIWQNAIQDRIQYEVVSIIPMYETVDVTLFDVSRSSNVSFLSLTFDTVIEMRSAVQDVDVNRFLEGPFDSQSEKVSFIQYLSATSCPEFEDITTIAIIVPKETGTLREGNTLNDEDEMLWLLVVVGAITGVIALATITIGYVRMIQRRKIDENELASRTPGNIKERRIESTPSVIERSQDGGMDISTLGDPILLDTWDKTPADVTPGIWVKSPVSHDEASTVGSGSEEYDYKKAYLDLESLSESNMGEASTVASQRQTVSTQDDVLSVNDIVSASGENVCDEVIPEIEYSVTAPPGMLGLILESSIVDGAPIVNSIKPFSALAYRVLVGDRLISVDDDDVSTMTASKVSQVIASKQSWMRTLTFKRQSIDFSNGVC